ncbi:FkbM family methyltransferase [Sulfurimonas sp.]
MFNNVVSYLRKTAFLKKSKFINNSLKKSSLIIARIIYGSKKKVKIANKYELYLDSCFAFSNYENWGQEHNACFDKLIELSKRNKVIFDIGGHIGLCALPMAKVTSKESKLYTFEPSNLNRYYLKKHIEINNLENIEIVEDLLGDSNKEKVDFFEMKDVSGTPSIVNVKDNFVKTYKKQITLDSFCKEQNLRPDLLKIDVEGAEYFVLNGASEIIKECKPDIVLSLHPKHLKKLNIDLNFLFEFAEDNGYKIYNCNSVNNIVTKNDSLLFDEYYLSTKV